MIVDSARLPDPAEGLKRLARFVEERSRQTSFSDLSWSRLTPWRVLLSRFFDVADFRPYLARLDHVEINYAGLIGDPLIPSEALLAAAWLASRLKWRPIRGSYRLDGQTHCWTLRSEQRMVTIQITNSQPSKDLLPRLKSLQLVVTEQPRARFVTSLDLDDRHLKTMIRLGRRKRMGKVVPVEPDGEAWLMGRELQIRAHDRVYEQGLSFLLSLYGVH